MNGGGAHPPQVVVLTFFSASFLQNCFPLSHLLFSFQSARSFDIIASTYFICSSLSFVLPFSLPLLPLLILFKLHFRFPRFIDQGTIVFTVSCTLASLCSSPIVSQYAWFV